MTPAASINNDPNYERASLLPLTDLRAEELVIGAVLAVPELVLRRCPLDAEDFFHSRTRLIAGVLFGEPSFESPHQPYTVAAVVAHIDQLERRHHWPDAPHTPPGSSLRAYLENLAGADPLAAYGPLMADRVAWLASRRRAVIEARETIRDAFAGAGRFAPPFDASSLTGDDVTGGIPG